MIFLKMDSGDVLGALFWWFPMGIKDAGFGEGSIDLTKRITSV